jgi:hypothetical protein
MAVKLLTKLGDGVLVPSVLARATEPVVNRWPVTMFANLSGNLTGRDRNGTFSLVGTGALRWMPRLDEPQNWVSEPGYESGGTTPGYGGFVANATVDWPFAEARTGQQSARVTCTQAGTVQVELLSMEQTAGPHHEGDTWQYSIWIKSNAQAAGKQATLQLIAARFILPGSSVIATQAVTLSTSYQRVVIQASVPRSINRLSIRLEFPNAVPGDVIYADDDVASRGVAVDGAATVKVLASGQLHSVRTPLVASAFAFIEEGSLNAVPSPQFFATPLGNYWVAYGGATLASKVSDGAFPYHFSAYGEVTTTGANQGVKMVPGTAPAVSAGQTWTASCAVRPRFGDTPPQLRLMVWGIDASNNVTETFTGPSFTANDDTYDWRLGALPSLTVTFANANTVKALVGIEQVSTGAVMWGVGCVGFEQKPYATSPIHGSLGTGYSWTGSIWASTSSRAATTLTFSPAGRVAPVRGSIVLAARRMVNTGGNQTLLDVGNGGAGTDRLTLRFTPTGALQLACQSNGGAVTTVTTAETAALGTEVICYAAWDGTDIGVRLGNGNLATGTRDAPAGSFGAGNASLGTRQDGSEPLNGALGPALVYASPLSPMHRDVLVARGPARWRYDLVRAA